MPKRVVIPMNPPPEGGNEECTSSYKVRYRRTNSAAWIDLIPAPIAPPFVLHFLQDDVEYVAEVRRVCCNAMESEPEIVTFTTSIG